MALTKEITYDYDIRSEYKLIGERRKTAIIEDGKELSYSYHRRVLAPDMDVSGECQEIQDMASAFWTDEIKAAWKVKQDSQL